MGGARVATVRRARVGDHPLRCLPCPDRAELRGRDHGWVYAIGIATAAAAMAASVPLRNVPLLALGTLAMFSYVTSVAARYLHESLGVPSALAIIGVLIIGLAVVSARLMRAAHPPKPRQPGAEKPTHTARPPKPTQPGAEKPSTGTFLRPRRETLSPS